MQRGNDHRDREKEREGWWRGWRGEESVNASRKISKLGGNKRDRKIVVIGTRK